jgi:hypothetical protein
MRSGSSDNYVIFLLAELKCAAVRSCQLTTEIESIGVALSGNFITPDDAMTWLHEAGGLGLIAVSSVTLVSTA